MNHRKVLKNMRQDHNLTQEQVAQASHGFLTKVTVQLIEQGRMMLNLSHMCGFCHAFDITLVSLFIAMEIPDSPDELDKQFNRIYVERKQKARK